MIVSKANGSYKKDAVIFNPKEFNSLGKYVLSCKYMASAVPHYKPHETKAIGRGGWRHNTNVIGLGDVVFLDIDKDINKKASIPGNEVEEARAIKIQNMYGWDEMQTLMDKSDYSYGMYSSRNRDVDNGVDKFRVVIPIDWSEDLTEYLINRPDSYHQIMCYIVEVLLGLNLQKTDDAAYGLTQYMESWGYIDRDTDELVDGKTDWKYYTKIQDEVVDGEAIFDNMVGGGLDKYLSDDTIENNSKINHRVIVESNEAIEDVYTQMSAGGEDVEARVSNCFICKGGNPANPYGIYTYYAESEKLHYRCWQCKNTAVYKPEFKAEV